MPAKTEELVDALRKGGSIMVAPAPTVSCPQAHDLIIWFPNQDDAYNAMLAFSVAIRAKPEETPSTTWAAPALGRAYNIVDTLRRQLAQPVDSTIDQVLRELMESIEHADTEMIDIAS